MSQEFVVLSSYFFLCRRKVMNESTRDPETSSEFNMLWYVSGVCGAFFFFVLCAALSIYEQAEGTGSCKLDG